MSSEQALLAGEDHRFYEHGGAWIWTIFLFARASRRRRRMAG
jgi:membrane carboxypeptidase/penicillin-binding protein